MTIDIPDNLESSIREVVHSGRFASVDDAMAEAARLLLQQLEQATPEPTTTEKSEENTSQGKKPFWKRVEELRKAVPAEEWETLPVDGAEQLDHYIYGSPKRPNR